MQQATRLPFTHSLLGRMILFGAAPAAIAMGAVLVLGAFRDVARVREAIPELLLGETQHVASQIRDHHRALRQRVHLLAAAEEAGLLGNREQTEEFLRVALLGQRDMLGIAVVWLDRKSGEPTESVGWRRPDPGVGRSDLRRVAAPAVPQAALDFCRAAIERGARGDDASFVGGPWERDGLLAVGGFAPIVVDGAVAGICMIEEPTLAISRLMASVDHAQGSEFLVVAPPGVVIAGSRDAASEGVAQPSALRTFDTMALGKVLGRFLDLPQGDPVLHVESDDPESAESCHYAAEAIGRSGWTLVGRQPESVALAAVRASLPMSIAVALVGSMTTGLLLCSLAWIVARRVRLAVKVTDAVASGDLTVEVPEVNDRGDTGLLLRSVRSMARSLAELVGRVRNASIQLDSTATEMVATVRHQEASTAAFGASSTQIAAAVNEISTTAMQLSGSMEQVRTMAGETAELATKGRSGLQEMETAMVSLDRGTESIAGRLATINEKASRITTIVTTITKVADQTNLLSVNAAIEAEKAGEYGAGFLVVAREIRRLADQTASATLDIDQMVQQMQSAVAAGVMEMDRFADQVRRGTHEVSLIGQRMADIIERVDRVNAELHSVAESVQQQAEGANQINLAMAQLTTNASQTMQSMREFGNAASDLQSAIAGLKSSVSQFKLQAA